MWTRIEVGGGQAGSNSKVRSPRVGIWVMDKEKCKNSWHTMTTSKPLH